MFWLLEVGSEDWEPIRGNVISVEAQLAKSVHVAVTIWVYFCTLVLFLFSENSDNIL